MQLWPHFMPWGLRAGTGILESAGRLWLTKERTPIETLEEYASRAIEGEFDAFDSAYQECEPSLEKLLQNLLESHQEHFVEIIE